jgi:predicted metal-dependent HD superfamily phosphohydrolase
MMPNDPTPRALVPPDGLVIAPTLYAELEASYLEPERHYHTFAHALDVARRVVFAHAESGFAEPREAYVAALFHDAVYDTSRKDNEAESARAARDAIARYGLPVNADRVARLIERTAEHGRATSLTPDEALFLDCDIGVLGGSADEYAAYERGVAAEYTARIPRILYRVGRKRFLESLLASPRLFTSAYFHDRLETQARENIRRAIAAL